MKIKNLSWVILIAACVLGSGYEIIDFLKGNFSLTYNLNTVITILSAFALLVIIALIDKKTLTVYKFKKNTFSGVFAFLSGFGLCFSAANAITSLSDEINTFSVLNVVFPLLGAIGIFVLGLFSITGKYNNKTMPFISTLPVLYGAYKLVTYFITYVAQSLTSSLFYDFFAIISMLLFLFYSASVKSKIPNKSAIKCTFVYGSTAILCSILWMLNILVVNKFSFNALLSYSNFDAILYFLFSLYALSTMLEISFNIGSKTGYELDDEDFSEEEQIYGKVVKVDHTYKNKPSDKILEETKIDYSSLLEDDEEDDNNKNNEDEPWLDQLNEILSNNEE